MYPTDDRPVFGIFVQEQVEDLRALGVDVEVLFFDGRASKRNYLRAVRAVRRTVREQRPDLVHAHYGLTGAVALCQRRSPVVTTFHGSDCSGEIPWQAAVSWGVARLSTPIFVSTHLADHLRLCNASIVPAAVDTEVFRRRDQGEARRTLGWPEDVAHALLLGSRAVRLKRADLFDAGVEHARAVVPELRTTSLEGLTRAEVATVMAAVDVAVLTSDNEGSPVTVREALASCTPVVSVAVGDAPTVLAGLPGCAIVEREPTAIGDAIVAAIHAGRPGELRERAAECSRPIVARKIVDVYETVLAQAGQK